MITALIVDDDQAILDLLEERLQSMGHVCCTAQSQTQAEEILDTRAFDYILLDLEIPNRFQGRADIVYGHNLLRKIRQTVGHSRTPVLTITAHGLKSHHLCAETMKLGATDFVGKPFGKDNPLEDRIREALRLQSVEKSDQSPAVAANLTRFSGGDLVFFEDRVELCGVKVCGARNSSNKRRVLDLLRERTEKGDFRCFSMKEIADRLRLPRPAAVAEAVADLKRECRDCLRDSLSLACGDNDVVSNQNRGYHIRDWIKVLEGLDAAEQAAEKRLALTEHQKGIIRLLRKHRARSPRQLADGLNLLKGIVANEVEGLAAAGLIAIEGNGANRIITTPGYPGHVEGRKAVAELYRPYGTMIVLDRCHDLAVHHDIKTGVVVLEYASEGRVVSTGAPNANRYISVLTITDRKVTHWRGYLDPVAVFDALGWPSR